MWITRNRNGFATLARLLCLGCTAVAALTADAYAQLPLEPVGAAFEMTGFIQKATVDDIADPYSGGTLTMNNHLIVVPRYTIFQMPATSLTWTELFTMAPAPHTNKATGFALEDEPAPDFTFEVTVQGNRVEPSGAYIAGLLFISNLGLQAHQGFIHAIDYEAGELLVGTARVRINDPIGRYGRAWTHDARFTIDEDNPTIKSETSFPMCLPRWDPAKAADPLCPESNRPLDSTGRRQTVITMVAAPEPTADERAHPEKRTIARDPWRMAPFEVGDYVTVRGPIVKDEAGQFISAFAIDANVGIFTAPGTKPAFVSLDVLLMGTGPNNDITLLQEGARRARAEGFTTDLSGIIHIAALDVNPCTGEDVERTWDVVAVDPGAPIGEVGGRWRFRPEAPTFDLKGYPFLPPTREVRVSVQNGADFSRSHVTTLNGLVAGEYTAPNFEFILPENRGVGTPPVPANFETMAFLVQGSGPRDSYGFTGQLTPWPGFHPPARNACANVGEDQTVAPGAPVTLDGRSSDDANRPIGAVSYRWSQVSGPAVALRDASSSTASFTAPGTPATLEFKLRATSTSNGTTAESRALKITVPDTARPTLSTFTTTTTSVTRGSSFTAKVNAVDNVGVTTVTFSFKGVTYAAVKSTSSTTPNLWTATIATTTATPTGAAQITATAVDAAGNVATLAGPTVSVR